MEIRSVKNNRVKEWKKLMTRKGRKKAGQYILEGFHLVEEALLHGAPIDTLIISEEADVSNLGAFPEEKAVYVSEDVAVYLAETGTTQGVFAIVDIPSPEEVSEIKGAYLLLDAVQDPGNVGTMIRTADAAGFTGVVLGEGTADLYNDKTLRSTQGSHFHLDVRQGDLGEWIRAFQSHGYPVYGTALDEKASSYQHIRPNGPFALIMGNEGQGVRSEILEMTDKNLYIPIKGQAESLNVAVAAGILMFHLLQSE